MNKFVQNKCFKNQMLCFSNWSMQYKKYILKRAKLLSMFTLFVSFLNISLYNFPTLRTLFKIKYRWNIQTSHTTFTYVLCTYVYMVLKTECLKRYSKAINMKNTEHFVFPTAYLTWYGKSLANMYLFHQ